MENRATVATNGLFRLKHPTKKPRNYYQYLPKSNEPLSLYSTAVSASTQLPKGPYSRRNASLLAAKQPNRFQGNPIKIHRSSARQRAYNSHPQANIYSSSHSSRQPFAILYVHYKTNRKYAVHSSNLPPKRYKTLRD